MHILTKDSHSMNLKDFGSFSVLGSKAAGIHWGWYIVALLLFWPALIVMLCYDFFSAPTVYNVKMVTVHGTEVDVEVDEDEFNKVRNYFDA